MGKGRKISFILVLGLSFSVSAAENATTSTTQTSAAPPGFNTPGQFNVAVAQSMGSIFGKCLSGPGFGQIADMGQYGASAVGPNGTCPGSESAGDFSSVDCKHFSDGSGGFNQSKYENALKKIKEARKTIGCKIGQVSRLKGEIGCLQSQADSLAQQVGSFQSGFTANIRQYQTDVAKIVAVKTDREGQQEFVQKRLNGDEKTGAKGLIALEETTRAMVKGMRNEILQIKEANKQLDSQRKALTNLMENRKMMLTNECFMAEKNESYRCCANDDDPNCPDTMRGPVSAHQYVLCRFQQNQHIGAGGQRRKSKVVDRQANARTSDLAAILSDIFNKSPIDPNLAKTPQEAQQLANKPIRVLTAADITSKYKGRLDKFNGNGLDVSGFVLKTYSSCFTKSAYSVDKERITSGTTFYVEAEKILTAERKVKEDGAVLLNTYSQQYMDSLEALVGQHMPLDTTACNKGTPLTLANCLDDVRKNLEGVLDGTTASSEMRISIPATDPANAIGLPPCRGLTGCKIAMQRVSDNLDREVKKLDAFKKDYVLKANQNVDAFVKKMAGLMNMQSQQLKGRVTSLNTSLASLGVRGSVSFKPVQGEDLDKDDDGLYREPKSALNVIGSKVNPPIMDAKPEDFTDALSGVADRINELKEKDEKLAQAEIDLSSLPATCKEESLGRLGDKIAEENLSHLDDCARSREFCEDEEAMGRLSNSIAEIVDEPEFEDLSSKLHGFNQACAKTRAAGVKADEEELEAKKWKPCIGAAKAVDKAKEDMEGMYKEKKDTERAEKDLTAKKEVFDKVCMKVAGDKWDNGPSAGQTYEEWATENAPGGDEGGGGDVASADKKDDKKGKEKKDKKPPKFSESVDCSAIAANLERQFGKYQRVSGSYGSKADEAQ